MAEKVQKALNLGKILKQLFVKTPSFYGTSSNTQINISFIDKRKKKNILKAVFYRYLVLVKCANIPLEYPNTI